MKVIAPAEHGHLAENVMHFARVLRAAEGPRMPLAILRKQGRDLPLQFTLDDSMAMAPQMNLSAFPRVVIGARVSKSANASAQPGDLQGASRAVANDASGVRVLIDSVVR